MRTLPVMLVLLCSSLAINGCHLFHHRGPGGGGGGPPPRYAQLSTPHAAQSGASLTAADMHLRQSSTTAAASLPAAHQG